MRFTPKNTLTKEEVQSGLKTVIKDGLDLHHYGRKVSTDSAAFNHHSCPNRYLCGSP